MGNCWVEFYKTSGGDSDVRGELGDRGNKGNGALNPEIFAKRYDTACLPKNHDIFACAGAIATKGIPFERYRRVRPESQFARGTDEWSPRYQVGEVGDDRGRGVWLRLGDLLERQRLSFARLAGWWAGLGWAHPSNFPVDASMQVAAQVVARGHSSTGSPGGSCGNRGCAAYLSMSMSTGCQGHKSEREVLGCAAYLNKSTHVLLERVYECSRTHYALNWGPEVALRLSDDLALLLRVAHATVVPRGGEGALTSGAETHLVEPFGSAAFNYPHPPRVAGLDSKEAFNCH
ncbi:hypothetical protein EDD16DRAFT_1730186 [Pisolithus croceorrhizus]|nr:hypothetical protein EDD16DRAFT_1730186 [Pisolithus croceorrhizus]